MFVHGNTVERLSLYRDVLAVYKGLVEEALDDYGLDKNIVSVKNSIEKNVNRAPLIILERGELQHIPRSLMFGEKVTADQNTNLFESRTAHMLEYPMEFTCYGNSYLEAEKLGGLAVEAILTTGLSIIKLRHPNIIGSEFVGWGKSGLAEGGDSSLVSCKVLGKVFLSVEGYYAIGNN
jgi:hypothetical protein